ncbi:uncharacterized protein NEMAJ01_0430 [Nematocida major]|uniref:uncharacterized protein n=1 Tax=Nematocida major TaxID=1912982 RepID=UPI00200813BA|nr:uncharacterized protein NEMAJ01_0430 [Nematocida major]KAH9385534.1 hypothetical protein NEMAJ01_0430 [Nematocida major]
MEYILKVSSKEELRGKLVFVDEYLGANSDSFISEVMEAFPSHRVVSYYKLPAEYRTENAVSFLDSEYQKDGFTQDSDILIIDGWRNRSNAVERGELVLQDSEDRECMRVPVKNKTVFLISRSIQQANYSDLYKGFMLVSMHPLKISTEHTHRLQITVRETRKEVALLYHHKAPRKYTLCA